MVMNCPEILKNKIKSNELKSNDYENIMKATFFELRNLKISKTPVVVQENLFKLNAMCENGNFEDHLLYDWLGSYGILGGTNNPLSATYIPEFVLSTSIDAFINVPTSPNKCRDGAVDIPNQSLQTHHTIVSYGDDPTLGPLLKTTHRTTFEPNNNYSFRLGNSCIKNGTEYLAKKFKVTGTGQIKFKYALVMTGPQHDPNNNPSFRVEVYNSSGVPISGAVFLDEHTTSAKDFVYSDNDDPFFQHTTIPNYWGNDSIIAFNYKDWACGRIELNDHVGEIVKVVLYTTDCVETGDFCYAYIDDWCGNCDGSTSGSVSINSIPDSCIEQGTKVCVNYSLPKIGTTVGSGTIKLQFYQNGNPFSYSLTSPSLTPPSGTYCFTIDPLRLPCTSGQSGYDVVATGNFSITTVDGTTPVTITSPVPINDPISHQIEGIRSGLNNDLVCCITADCCTGFVKKVTTVSSMVGNTTTGYNTIKFEPTFSVGPRPIKQVRISVINFESSSSNKECLSCESNTVRYGTMSVPQGIFGGGKDAIEGMVYPTKPNIINNCYPVPCPSWNTLPSSEVTWGSQSGPGYNLMDGIGDQSTKFTVSLPKISTLPCCDDTIKICIKYSFTDVDCKTCDTIICYRIVNRLLIQSLISKTSSSNMSSLQNISFKVPDPKKGIIPQKVPNQPTPEVAKDIGLSKTDPPLQPLAACNCGSWNSKKLNFSGAGNTGTVAFSSYMDVQVGTPYTFSDPVYFCTPSGCNATYEWKVDGIVKGIGSSFSYIFTTAGWHPVTVQPYCGNDSCPPRSFKVNVKKPTNDSCHCLSWQSKKLNFSGAGTTGTVVFNSYMDIQGGTPYTFSDPLFFCTPSGCNATYEWKVDGIVKGTGSSFSYSFTTTGSHIVAVQPYCGSNSCPPLTFKVNVKK
jgi:hypothetical protein